MPSILRKSTKLPLKSKETVKCVVTGLPAKYRDPKSGLYFANLEAFRTIKNGKIKKKKRKVEGAAKPRPEAKGWEMVEEKIEGERRYKILKDFFPTLTAVMKFPRIFRSKPSYKCSSGCHHSLTIYFDKVNSISPAWKPLQIFFHAKVSRSLSP